MYASVIAALKRRYRSGLHERASDLMEGGNTFKLYLIDVTCAVEWISDIMDKVFSPIILNCWCFFNILQISYQNSEENTHEDNELHDFIEEDNFTSTAEN